MNTTTNTRGVYYAAHVKAVARALQTDDAAHYAADAAHMLEDYAAAIEAALSAPEPAAQPEDSRCPPTYRREEAVKVLIRMGWTWEGKAWIEPAARGEAVCTVGMFRGNYGESYDGFSREDAARLDALPAGTKLYTALSAEPAAQGEDGTQPSRPKPRMPISPLGIEDFCYCDNTVSLQAVSGGGAPEGYLGKVRLKVNGEFVPYVREGSAPPAQPAERVPDGWVLVPREPTEEMLAQAATHDTSPRDAATDQWNRDTWNFMLDAAPEPPASPAPSPARGDGGEG